MRTHIGFAFIVLAVGLVTEAGTVVAPTLGSGRTFAGERGRVQDLPGQSRTILPDGRILVFGGIDVDGAPSSRAEIVRGDGVREMMAASGLPPRAYHSATLLTDGRVLVAGGSSRGGRAADTAFLWDPRTRQSSALASRMVTGRRGHTATLMADGSVVMWGGLGAQAVRLTDGERFDPDLERFEWWTVFPDPSGVVAPSLAGSIPADGAVGVPSDAVPGLRFSQRMARASGNGASVVLSGPEGIVGARVVVAESGMLAFVNPVGPLQSATRYTITLSGLQDLAGRVLAPMSVTFVTADEDGSGGRSPVPNEDPVDPTERPEDDIESNWESLPPLKAPPGVTALAGQVLLLNGRPLPGVTLEIEGASARSDGTGRFLIQGVQAGHHELEIDGSTANRAGATYGFFEVGVDIVAGQTNVLPYKNWMPRIETQHAVTIQPNSPVETVVGTPRIPGLELHIPPNTVIRDHDGKVVTEVSITPIPVDRPPFPLPQNVEVPIYYTIQPGAAYVYSSGPERGAQIYYPNYNDAPPATGFNFWHYDPEEQGWYIYGAGTVTPDGKQVVPDEGVAIYEFTGAMINDGQTPPGSFPPPGSTPDGDPVDLNSGLFILEKTDLHLPGVMPLALTRTSLTKDNVSRSFGVGATHAYEMFLWTPSSDYAEANLILPNGARIHYDRITPDSSNFSTAVFEHTTSPTRFYRSRLSWNGLGWDLRLKDGTVYVFGENNPLQGIRDRHGNAVTITRTDGQRGNITRVSSSTGRWMEFSYDASNRITQVKDNIGRAVTYQYNGNGRLIKVTDPEGGTTHYTYSGNRIATIKDARGIVFLTNAYDANGNVSVQTQPDSSKYQFAYIQNGHGDNGQADITWPNGAVRRVVFNDDGYPLSDTRALGTPEEQVITYTRQPGSNLPLSVTDELGRRTEFVYDSLGNVTKITRLAGTPDSVTTRFTYEPVFSQVASITDPLNHTTSFEYDDFGNLTAVVDPRNKRTELTYNGSGQPLTVTDPLQHTTSFEYQFEDLVAVVDALNNRVSWFYDGAGRVASSTDALGALTRYEHDRLNQLKKIVDSVGKSTSFLYDPNGNLLRLTDAKGDSTAYIYDVRDRLASRKDPLGRTETFQYDSLGNMTRHVDRKGQVTTHRYDRHGRDTLTTYDDLSTISSTYDGGNRLVEVVDSQDGTIELTYDRLNRLIGETNPRGSVTYGYDAAGRRTGMTVGGQTTVTYDYDAADRLTDITQGSLTVEMAYDDANRRTSITGPNDITIEYAYDIANLLTSISYKRGLTTLGDLAYGYDATGRRVTVGGTWARTGLPAAVTATYDAANQILSFGGQTFTHDATGALTNDGMNAYNWNARQELTSILGSTTTATFQYDGLARRRQKAINGTVTAFMYDGLNPVQELSGGAVVASMLTGLGLDETFTRTAFGETQTLLPSELGSTIALADSSGAIRTEYTYEPFGLSSATGTEVANAIQFTGRENDNTGLYFYRARYYSPLLQRFISSDPLGITFEDVNEYTYARNNPLRWRDPLGLYAEGGVSCSAVFATATASATSTAGRKDDPPSIDWCESCIAACAGGIPTVVGFCRVLMKAKIHPAIRAACWSVTNSFSVQSCLNMCDRWLCD